MTIVAVENLYTRWNKNHIYIYIYLTGDFSVEFVSHRSRPDDAAAVVGSRFYRNT